MLRSAGLIESGLAGVASFLALSDFGGFFALVSLCGMLGRHRKRIVYPRKHILVSTRTLNMKHRVHEKYDKTFEVVPSKKKKKNDIHKWL
ncbi:uncharacterized protein BO97DRAFT_114756 [Aspergillus homomorphus CBS 101889]|uniref:Uncharacterized protein n=1 Tax=Aspergillus homomorphus (strain CBS 101889) TaxID=1450537 RepID=A0A395HTY1_ASPHC|nr:hypothetical protein BO97DRAFT_114756 [Aspergillus homomorphus CBS 101889]RAL10845.1 hypothetical protein BO97DRAFT_114756 [Aspergillus homomorphus CBS 101889]